MKHREPKSLSDAVSAPFRGLYISNKSGRDSRLFRSSLRPLPGSLYFQSSPPHPTIFNRSNRGLRGKIIFVATFPYADAENPLNTTVFKVRGKITRMPSQFIGILGTKRLLTQTPFYSYQFHLLDPAQPHLICLSLIFRTLHRMRRHPVLFIKKMLVNLWHSRIFKYP